MVGTKKKTTKTTSAGMRNQAGWSCRRCRFLRRGADGCRRAAGAGARGVSCAVIGFESLSGFGGGRRGGAGRPGATGLEALDPLRLRELGALVLRGLCDLDRRFG